MTIIIHGMSVANRGALRNPDSLEFYIFLIRFGSQGYKCLEMSLYEI